MGVETPWPPCNDPLHLRQVIIEVDDHLTLFRIQQEWDPVDNCPCPSFREVRIWGWVCEMVVRGCTWSTPRTGKERGVILVVGGPC